MLKKTILFITLFLLFGFLLSFNIKKVTYTVELAQETNNSHQLEFSYFNRELRPLDWAPRFKKKIIETYKGIPIHDSLVFYSKSENAVQFKYDLYKAGEFDKADYLKFISERRIDTSGISKNPIKQGFIVIIGFYKNKQFIIADLNRNEDFSDDIKYEFDINFRKESSDIIEPILEKLPNSTYSYQTYNNGTIHTYTRKLVFYPAMFESPSITGTKEAEYLSKFRYRDYWKGEKTIDNTVYDFFYQSIDNAFGSIFIKPKNISFKKNDAVFNNQFMHYTNDTIVIGNTNFKIDSINRSISKLYLRELSKNKKNYGNSIGTYLKDYVINDLNGKPFKISDISKEKKYTLIDFWGTWCGPCVKMTPALKKLSLEKESKLNIIGVANDENVNVVQEYVTKKNILWKNGFTKLGSPILKGLQISQFPTFILIDSDNKIIYRGGSDSFETILKLIR